jgi:hypothetical protein
LVGISLFVGAAVACAVHAMPPYKVDVSLWQIATAWSAGNRTSAANAAFLSSLDEMGKKVLVQPPGKEMSLSDTSTPPRRSLDLRALFKSL